MHPDIRQQMGRDGEDVACAELKRRGYVILVRRYRTRLGELDIVARDGPTLVFVEVKARRHDECGSGLEAITRHKRRRLVRMAQDFLARARLGDVPCRFDVVAISPRAGGRPAVEVVQSAFVEGE
ncbi:MAG: YraN family protein [Acidobacteria bacterium]|nr:YraN family protein [Acidobacteriota bacterium]